MSAARPSMLLTLVLSAQGKYLLKSSGTPLQLESVNSRRGLEAAL